MSDEEMNDSLWGSEETEYQKTWRRQDAITRDIIRERERQTEKWGLQRHSFAEWIAILVEEVGEASEQVVEYTFRNKSHIHQLREELIHTAAVAVQILEHIDELIEEEHV